MLVIFFQEGIPPFQGFWLRACWKSAGLRPSVVFSALSGLMALGLLEKRRAVPFGNIFRPFRACGCERAGKAQVCTLR
jgi:hypothetical protein